MYDLLIIVPYRDRLEHLRQFAPHMDRFLAGKQSFKLLVVEQTADAPFNRAKLINAGAALGTRVAKHLVMHDVDMLPADESCDYRPGTWPVHLAGRASQYDWKKPYLDYIGGVFMLSQTHFEQCNGMSNEFWGWGREDDEFAHRLRHTNLRWDSRDGRYQSLDHPKGTHREENHQRLFAFWEGQYDRWDDGLLNVQFEIKGDQRLAQFLRMQLAPQHEIVTVDLLWPGAAS